MNNIFTREINFMKIAYIISSIIFLVYLLLPNPTFPSNPESALQSVEPADLEITSRRSYYTDTDREKVMNSYSNYFKSNLSIFSKLNYRLNYPPEEAQTIIRDQARSTYLEEIVHPFRESLFVNGYEPKENKDVILVDNKFWKYKITVKLQDSTRLARLIVGFSIILFFPIIILYLNETMTDFFLAFKKAIQRSKHAEI